MGNGILGLGCLGNAIKQSENLCVQNSIIMVCMMIMSGKATAKELGDWAAKLSADCDTYELLREWYRNGEVKN